MLGESVMHKILYRLKLIYDRIRKDPGKPLAPPIMNPFGVLFSKFFPSLACRLREWRLNADVSKTKRNYVRQLDRIRDKFGRGEKIRVMFIVTQSAKWKAASLYSALDADDCFEVQVAVSCPESTIGLPPTKIAADQGSNLQWFVSHGYECVKVYDPFEDVYLELDQFNPDIVFYPEVWYDHSEHHPKRVSSFALTCYIPYFTPNYVDIDLDCCQPMHRFYWCHIVANDELVNLYRNATSNRLMAGEFVGLGHTMFDALSLTRKTAKGDKGESSEEFSRKCAIYAPHWTFDHPKNPTKLHYSTFSTLGLAMLEYARKHPEIDWVFKPHPSLYSKVISSGLMSRNEIDRYYESWKKLGHVVLGPDYVKWFHCSKVMITDCGSFLSEYGVTGHPIIYLISSKNNSVPPPTIKRIYDTYYKVRTESELYSALGEILEEGRDPNKDIRLSALSSAKFLGNNAADNIKRYLCKCCSS